VHSQHMQVDIQACAISTYRYAQLVYTGGYTGMRSLYVQGIGIFLSINSEDGFCGLMLKL
jgi:hypothetical protein